MPDARIPARPSDDGLRDADALHPEVHYEKSDARIGPIASFAAGLIGLGLIVHGVSVWLFHALSTGQDERPLSKLAAKERPQFPRDFGKIPAPVLQQSETADMNALRQAEEKRLTSHGWVDAKKKIVRIPVAEAMRLLAGDAKLRKAHGMSEDVKKERKR